MIRSFRVSGAILVAALLLIPHGSEGQPARRKRLLAWGDTLTAYQHDSISHALVGGETPSPPTSTIRFHTPWPPSNGWAANPARSIPTSAPIRSGSRRNRFRRPPAIPAI